MFKNLKVAGKIALGFGLLILIAMALGGVAFWNMKNVAVESTQVARDYVPQVKTFTEIESSSLQAMSSMRAFILSADEAHRNQGLKAIENVKKLFQQAKDLAQRSQALSRLRGQIDQAVAKLAQYEAAVEKTSQLNQSITQARLALDRAGKNFIKACNDYLDGQNRALDQEVKSGAGQEALLQRIKKIDLVKKILVEGGILQVDALKSQIMRDPKLLEETLKGFENIARLAAEIKAVTSDSQHLQQVTKIQTSAQTYRAAMDKLRQDWVEVQKVEQEQRKIAADILAAARDNAADGLNQAQTIAAKAEKMLETASTVMIIGLAAALILGVVLAVVITRSVTKPLNRVIDSLNAGSDQVAAASSQVSASSQSLAEGASEQAAAVEQTSASLEQLNAMTRSNADNAQQADALTKDADRLMTEAGQAMNEMAASMEQIAEAGQEISKIVKSIDEIAFQTNLLALNAAVEAARAGEAGQGFAVVADEVRALAMRAAEAAKHTQSLVEGTVGRINQGAELVTRTQTSFTEVTEATNKVAHLVNEIANASQEQAQGIEQIDQAMGQMDQATQQVAANAEEGASAAEELSAQAMTMKEMVGQLVALVGGTDARDGRRGKSTQPEEQPVHRRLLLPARGEAKAETAGPGVREEAKAETAAPVAREVRPEEVIPLDGEEDLTEF